MARATKLRTQLRKLLEDKATTADDVLELLRNLTVDHPSCFKELFPDEGFYGSVKRRAPESQRREQMRRANTVSLVTKRGQRAERQDQVKTYLATKGENLTLPQMAAFLNESDIRPARGGEWTKQIVFRLLDDSGDDDPS